VERFATSSEKLPIARREDDVTIPHLRSNGSETVQRDETKGGDAMTSGNWTKGTVAGLAATVVLSALMLMKAVMGVMPELNPIKMIADMLGAPPTVGWLMHFMIGTVFWGTLFVWLNSSLLGESQWLKGIVFAIGAWLVMMVAMMPMAGAGFFGSHLGMMTPVMTLMLHIVFGFVLGAVYGLERPDPTPEFQGTRT
jgi:hypothetical protein